MVSTLIIKHTFEEKIKLSLFTGKLIDSSSPEELLTTAKANKILTLLYNESSKEYKKLQENNLALQEKLLTLKKELNSLIPLAISINTKASKVRAIHKHLKTIIEDDN